jgi:hypothetical protein
VLEFFGISIFGGGESRPTPPPMLYRFFHYVAAEFLGLLPCLAPNMYDSAAVEAAAIFAPPFAALSANPPSTSGNPYGGPVSMAQYVASSPSAAPNPQIKKAPPVPAPKPTPYPQCMARYFAGANAKYAELPGACVAGGISCLLTGLPIACVPGYAACLGGLFIEAKCYKQSEGQQ